MSRIARMISAFVCALLGTVGTTISARSDDATNAYLKGIQTVPYSGRGGTD
jgi:hypothetical protein